MKTAWKKVAERAWKPAFTCDQVAESIPRALVGECDRALVMQVEAALVSTDQGVLFEESRQSIASRVNSLRSKCAGSPFGNNLIDAAVYEIYHDRSGNGSLPRAVEAALKETAASAYRGIEEHGLRKQGLATASKLRERLEEADRSVDYGQLQSHLMSPRGAPQVSGGLQKRSGIDEGVALP